MRARRQLWNTVVLRVRWQRQVLKLNGALKGGRARLDLQPRPDDRNAYLNLAPYFRERGSAARFGPLVTIEVICGRGLRAVASRLRPLLMLNYN